MPRFPGNKSYDPGFGKRRNEDYTDIVNPTDAEQKKEVRLLASYSSSGRALNVTTKT